MGHLLLVNNTYCKLISTCFAMFIHTCSNNNNNNNNINNNNKSLLHKLQPEADVIQLCMFLCVGGVVLDLPPLSVKVKMNISLCNMI